MQHIVSLIQLHYYLKYFAFKVIRHGREVLQSMHHVVTLIQLHSYKNYFVFKVIRHGREVLHSMHHVVHSHPITFLLKVLCF